MSDTPKPAKVDIEREAERFQEWKQAPVVGFDQRASLVIAQWVLMIFGGVYLLAFISTFLLFWRTDATFEKGSDLIKFMIQSPLPLVTLAVGYYLGDRNRQSPSSRGRR